MNAISIQKDKRSQPVDRLILFPIVVERQAGFDVAELGAVTATRTAPLSDPTARTALCDRLEQVIRQRFDDGDAIGARSVINLKRALFNKRAVPDERVLSLLASDLRAEVEALLVQDQATAPPERLYREQLERSAAHLDRFAERPELAAALAFSGQERPRLLRTRRDDGRVVKPGERRRSHAALLQYGARAAAKTTPFSYFGSAALVPASTAGPVFSAPSGIESRLSLDPAVALRLTWAILLHYAPVRAALKVRVRRDMQVQPSGGYRWVAAPIDLSNRELWGAAVSQLRVPPGPMADAITALERSGGSSLAGLGLADAHAVALLISRAIEPVDIPGEQEPLLKWLHDLLDTLPNTTMLCAALKPLVALEQGASSSSPGEAVEDLARARRALDAAYVLIGKSRPVESKPPLSHATTHVTAYREQAVTLAEFEAEWTALGQLARHLSRGDAVRTRLADRFVARHGATASVNAARFFLDQAADPAMTAWRPDFATFTALLQQVRWSDEGSAILPAAELSAAIPQTQRARTIALGAQVQWTVRDEQPALVLNRTVAGALWLTARHLEPGPDHAAKAVAFLSAAHPGARLAALPGTFGVAAARCQRLLDVELLIPGIEVDRRNTSPLPLTDLAARMNRDEHRVALYDHSGHEVAPVPTGAVNPWLLPPVLRLLAENASGTSLSIYASLWRHLEIAARRPGRAALAMIPELRVGRLVLARETMLYVTTSLPVAEDLREMQARLLDWLAARGLPPRLFIRFPDGPLVERFCPGGRRGGAERHHVKAKPAFYDLTNPIFCTLLRQQLRSGAPLISIQSCDPDPVAGERARELQCELVLEGRR